MLSMRDCLDYCNLSDDAVALVAEHENIPKIAAAQLCCGLVQTPEGALLLGNYMQEVAERAHHAGRPEQAESARRIRDRFLADHAAGN
jgi:hypothetical protein